MLAQVIRFVLLYHQFPTGGPGVSHWDFMLEQGSQLMTFRFDQLPRPTNPSLPQLKTAQVLDALRLKDHRLAYLDYEGPVSGNRGQVTQVAAGTARLRFSEMTRIQCNSPRHGHPEGRQERQQEAQLTEVSTAEATLLCHCRLLSGDLDAELQFVVCEINQQTKFEILCWSTANRDTPATPTT